MKTVSFGLVVVELAVAVVLTWLFFAPIKNYVAEAVRPTVRALLTALDLGQEERRPGEAPE
jgi:large-conductance mechanosensitive channel